MYNFLTKYGQLLSFGVGFLLIAIFYILASGGLGDFNGLPKEEQFQTGIFNFGLGAALLLVIVAAALAILFGIYHIVTNPKGAMKAIIGVGVIVVLFFVLYSMADGSFTENQASKFGITEGISKYVSAALNTGLALGAIVIVAFIVGEVRNFFK